jgi:hypothetical protein
MRAYSWIGALVVFGACSSHTQAGFIAISVNDFGNNNVQVRDSTTGNLLYNWAPDGGLADIAIDQATGMLYAATQGGVFRRHISGVGPISNIGINNFLLNHGGDLAVQGGMLTYHSSDFFGDQAIVFNTNNNTFQPNFQPFAGLISDVAMNATNGMVYAAAQGGIFRRAATSAGPYTGFGPGFPGGFGGDIAVFGNHLIYSLHDQQSAVFVWDLVANTQLNPLTWAPDGLLSDIAIDHLTGIMYGAAQGGIYKRSLLGGPTTLIPGIAGFGVDSGADIAVYSEAITSTPEPTSLALLGMAFAGFGVGKRFRRSRHAGLAP